MKEVIKKYWKFAVAGIIILILLFVLCAFVSWKKSPRFARFEIAMAYRNNDTTIAEKYYDYEKIVDKYISEIMEDAQNDPFGGLAVAMVANLRPTLINQLKNSVEEGIEQDKEFKKRSIIDIFWRSYNVEPSDAIAKVEKINKKKEIYYTCPFKESGCIKFTWEKGEKNWQITEMSINPIPVQEVFNAEK